MICSEFKANRNADGSYSVSMDGKQYRVNDMSALVHFLAQDSYEGVKEENTRDNERNSN